MKWQKLWLYLFLATISHGLLDAMTGGGLGVAFFAPFVNTRYFFPFRPIRVSPIGSSFFSARGFTVLESEIIWIWIPSAAVGIYKLFKPEDVEAKLASEIQTTLNTQKQSFFDAVHPMGTARSVKVIGINSAWKTAHPRSMDELKGFKVEYVLYWQSPLISDGYSKIASSYDADIGRFVAHEVLTTNGTTRKDVKEKLSGAFGIVEDVVAKAVAAYLKQ